MSEITVTRYTQSQTIGKPNTLLWEQEKPKGLKGVTKIGHGYLCQRGINLRS